MYVLERILATCLWMLLVKLLCQFLVRMRLNGQCLAHREHLQAHSNQFIQTCCSWGSEAGSPACAPKTHDDAINELTLTTQLNIPLVCELVHVTVHAFPCCVVQCKLTC